MKSLGRRGGGGNINLRGKLRVMCSCRCCEMINPKQKILKIEHQKEMRFWSKSDMTNTI
jgi:hypothetical protein